MLAANLLDGLSGMHGTIGVDRDVDDAKIDTQEVRRLNRGVLGHLHRAIEEELASAIDEINLPLHAVEPLALVLAINQGQDHPTSQAPEADLVQALESQDPVVVAERPIGA